MIADVMESAKDIVKSVVALDSRAGLAAMHYSDPTMRKAPIPCAWVIYAGMSNQSTETTGVPGVIEKNYDIIVKVLLSYNTESDLLDIQYPVLDAIRIAMTTTKIDTPACQYFKFEQEILEEIDDRLVYNMRFSFVGD